MRTANYIDIRGAVHRAGQALNLEPKDVNKIAKSCGTLDNISDSELRDTAEHFMGHIQSYGMHASAVVIFPDEPANWCAIEKQKDNYVVAQDFHLLEEQGLLKLDCLAIEQLDIMDLVLKNLGKDWSFLSEIPTEDEDTAKMLQEGLTFGCFQISSGLMTGIIQNIHAKNQSDLINVVALGRPGPLDSGMVKQYVERVNGEPIPRVYPAYDEIVRDTKGIILYQEQIMKVAQKLCGYTLGEADGLRKIVGRKIVDEMGPAMEEFITRGIKFGTPEKILRPLADAISKSANYIFNKSHAAAYGITAWRTAYLKAHYPAEYLCALLNFKKDDKDKVASIIEEGKKMRVVISHPEIFHSGFDSSVSDANHVYMGVNSILSGGQSLKKLKYDETMSAFDILKENEKLNKKALINLVKSGFFNGNNRSELIEYIEWLKDKHVHKPPFEYSGNIIADDGEMEMEVLGYNFKNIFDGYRVAGTDSHYLVAVFVTELKPWKTKKDKPMFFVKGIDKAGKRDLVYFGNGKIEEKKVYIMRLEGDVIRDFDLAKRI